MLNREELEKAVIYSNKCLKRWAAEKTHLLTSEHIHSMVNGWLVRVLSRNAPYNITRRKCFSKQISKSLFVTFNGEKNCITNILVENFFIPNLDYAALNDKANEETVMYLMPNEISKINISTIESIKFN